jgi:hypothetical protein
MKGLNSFSQLCFAWPTYALSRQCVCEEKGGRGGSPRHQNPRLKAIQYGPVLGNQRGAYNRWNTGRSRVKQADSPHPLFISTLLYYGMVYRPVLVP